YNIPKSYTMGKSILRVRNISFGSGAATGWIGQNAVSVNATLEAGKQMVNALTPIPQISSAYVYLIGENVVAIKHNIAMPQEIYLNCVLEMDTALNHLQASAYVDFFKMFKFATQSYIYNTLRV